MQCANSSFDPNEKERFVKVLFSLREYTGAIRERMLLRPVILMMFVVLVIFRNGFAEDLNGVYRQAVETSPVLKQARAMLDANLADKRRALAALMPKVASSAAISRENADIKGFGKDFSSPALPGNVFQDIDKTYTGGSYSVTLVQPLLDGQAWSAWNAAENLVQAGEAAVIAAEQDLTLGVTEAYFNVLNAQSRLRVAESQKVLLEEILDQARAALNVGSGEIIALQEARARCDAAQSALISAQKQCPDRPPGAGAADPRAGRGIK